MRGRVVGLPGGARVSRAAAAGGGAGSLVSMDPAAESAAAAPDTWWRLYDDSRLDGLVQEALRANRTLAAAQANLSAAQAVVAAIHAKRYPATTASVGGSMAATRQPMRFSSSAAMRP